MLYIALALLILSQAWQPAAAAELIRFDNTRLVTAGFNDGDSFQVLLHNSSTGAETHAVIRLYFVDCAETRLDRDFYRRRLRNQADHFGVTDARRLLKFGQSAADYVAEALTEPFTVHTAFAETPGAGSGSRYYAFVTTNDGTDLGGELVSNGLARVFGVGRRTPGGSSADEQKKRLKDLELQAALARNGIWGVSESDEIVRLRELHRKEQRRILTLKSETSGPSIDINRAKVDELVRLPGIGPVLAQRIMDARPYDRAEDLLRVRGIGPATLAKIRGRISVKPD